MQVSIPKRNSVFQNGIKDLTNFSELCNMAFRYERNTLSLNEVTDRLTEWYVLGYEVWVDGKIKGFSFALLVNGIYTLDGYNEGVSVFTASKMGKMVCRDLFSAGITDVIYTAHYTDELASHALVKRIGFKKTRLLGDRTYFENRQ